VEAVQLEHEAADVTHLELAQAAEVTGPSAHPPALAEARLGCLDRWLGRRRIGRVDPIHVSRRRLGRSTVGVRRRVPQRATIQRGGTKSTTRGRAAAADDAFYQAAHDRLRVARV
jgi:hypothetical protein